MPDTTDRVLVTGATGFIAGHCIEELLMHGYRVRGTVRRPDDVDALAHLHALAAAHGGDLQLVEAHLDRDDGWQSAAADCPLVLHTASPLPLTTPDDVDAFVRPAVEGTQRVLAACAGAGARRVVVTSSTASILHDDRPDSEPLTEEDWADPDRCSPYPKSKVLAERAAWALHEGLSDDERFELVVLNPCLVLGPLQRDRANSSIEPLRRLLARQMPAVPALAFSVVDVRDVATAHRLALEHPEAPGNRFLLAADNLWLRDISKVLAEAFAAEGFRPPTRGLPYPALWLVSRFQPALRPLLSDVGRRRILSSDKARRVLGWTTRPVRDTVIETGRSLIDRGIVRAPTR